MAMKWLQDSDPSTAALNAADLYLCRIVVPYVHALKNVYVFSSNVVTTGNVTLTVKRVDPGASRAGATVGRGEYGTTGLNNSDLGDHAKLYWKYTMTLLNDDKLTAPAFREYFIVLTGDNSADRFDEPVLVLEVDDSP
jgi:hypothetical protein